MKKILFFAVAGLLTLASCTKDLLSGSGNVITETRSVQNFTKVTMGGSSAVHIIQGAAFKVEVKGYSNLVPHMQTKVTNNTLQVGYESGVNVKNSNVEIWVTLPQLEGVTLNGSANIKVEGSFNGIATMDASVSGSGNIFIEAGDAQNFKSSVSGSGNIKAFDFTSQAADVSISGSGTVEVKAVKNLKVSISGSGTAYYKGQPILETSISGSGKAVHK